MVYRILRKDSKINLQNETQLNKCPLLGGSGHTDMCGGREAEQSLSGERVPFQ